MIALSTMASILLSLVAAPDSSGADVRVTTIFSERVDGVAKPSSRAELAFSAQIVSAGLKLVDEAQSRKIRSVNDAGRIVGGGVPEVLTNLDADVLVAGVVEITRRKTELLGESAARFDANLDARVIWIDTGEVLGVFHFSGSSLGFAPASAIEASAKQVGELLAQGLLAKIKTADRPRSIELVVEGVPDVAASDHLLELIRRLPDTSQAEVRHAGRGMTKIEIVSQRAPRELALQLAQQAASGLTVIGHGRGTIKAEYSISRAASLTLASSVFEGPSGKGVPKGRGELFVALVAAPFSGSPLLNVLPERWPVTPARAQKSAAAKAHLPPERTLVLSGRFGKAQKGKIQVETTLSLAGSGRPLGSAAAQCALESISECGAELGNKLLAALSERIAKNDPAFGPKLVGNEPALATTPKPLRITAIDAGDAFAAAYGHYRSHFGVVHFKNEGPLPVKRLRLSAQLEGLSAGASLHELAEIGPGQSAELEFGLALAPDKLAQLGEERPASLRLELEYESDELSMIDQASRVLLVRPRNALSWSDERAIAAFVTPTDPLVLERARTAYRASSSRRALPAALFAAMRGVGYTPDPSYPYQKDAIDYVELPAETLLGKSGDCDDLAVLYAALAEAVGVRSLLLTTEGHILAAIDTGVPMRNAAILEGDQSLYLEHEGRAFLPVETTLTGKPFLDAWKAGASAVAEAKKSGALRVIALDSAWRDFPPAAFASARAPTGADTELAQVAAAESLRFDNGERERLEKARAAASSGSADARQLRVESRILTELGKLDEAKAVLERALASGQEQGAVANNLGNVALLGQRPKDALSLYERALKTEPKSVAVHLNAAAAAWLAGDLDRFGEHVASCVAADEEAAVRALAESGLAQLGALKSAKGGGGLREALAAEVEKAFKKRGKSTAGVATRAENASDKGEWISGFLFWL